MDTSQPVREAPVHAQSHRKITDDAIIRMRAEGSTLKQISLAAGVHTSTLSEWFRREPNATRLKAATRDVELDRQSDKIEAELAEKQSKKRVRKPAPPKPEPDIVWNPAEQSYDAYVAEAAAKGQHAKVLRWSMDWR